MTRVLFIILLISSACSSGTNQEQANGITQELPNKESFTESDSVILDSTADLLDSIIEELP